MMERKELLQEIQLWITPKAGDFKIMVSVIPR